jgi:AbrB family looped-hinge helix DNA binding protein
MDALLTLSSKGHLVIPARLRQLLRLQPGDRLALSLEADGLRWIPGAALEFGADGFDIFCRSMSLPVALYTNVLVACCWT